MYKNSDKEKKTTEKKHHRRSFFKQISKYLLGIGTFVIASLYGFRRSGELKLGKIKKIELSSSKAQGQCSTGMNCPGGGGQCSTGMNCPGS